MSAPTDGTRTPDHVGDRMSEKAGRIVVFAFECSIPDAPWGEHWQLVNAQSRGAAKAEYWRDVSESWPSIPYTAVRCRKVGPPRSDDAFLIGVRYRGIPHTRCGDRVTWKNGGGVIVGFGGGGAWLEVLADEGWRGYVHPAECLFPDREVRSQEPGKDTAV